MPAKHPHTWAHLGMNDMTHSSPSNVVQVPGQPARLKWGCVAAPGSIVSAARHVTRTLEGATCLNQHLLPAAESIAQPRGALHSALKSCPRMPKWHTQPHCPTPTGASAARTPYTAGLTSQAVQCGVPGPAEWGKRSEPSTSTAARATPCKSMLSAPVVPWPRPPSSRPSSTDAQRALPGWSMQWCWVSRAQAGARGRGWPLQETKASLACTPSSGPRSVAGACTSRWCIEGGGESSGRCCLVRAEAAQYLAYPLHAHWTTGTHQRCIHMVWLPVPS